MKKALLVAGHGSRSLEAQQMFNQIVDYVRERAEGYELVKGAHMEICGPSIREIVTEIYNDGIKEIIMVPHFLYKGIHLKKDIPNLIGVLEQEFEGLTIKLCEPIGAEELLADILIKRANA